MEQDAGHEQDAGQWDTGDEELDMEEMRNGDTATVWGLTAFFLMLLLAVVIFEVMTH